MEIKKEHQFWYESNPCWGHISKLEHLIEKLKLQLAENNSIYNVKDFLTKSKQHLDYLDFGTRREHNGEKTLKDYLIQIGQLENFMIIVKKENL